MAPTSLVNAAALAQVSSNARLGRVAFVIAMCWVNSHTLVGVLLRFELACISQVEILNGIFIGVLGGFTADERDPENQRQSDSKPCAIYVWHSLPFRGLFKIISIDC